MTWTFNLNFVALYLLFRVERGVRKKAPLQRPSWLDSKIS